MAIVELAPRIAMVPGGVNIGVLRGDDGRCVLIDTGLHETSAKKALKAVKEELGGEVVAILTTHAHADHFGGNATVVKRTGATVYAPSFDEAILRYPLLQPALLFAGADPPSTMRGSFMLAAPSPVDVVLTGGRIEIEGFEIEIVPLKGHSPNQFGYLVDGVFFCADIVLPESVLEKYRIPYLFSVRDHLESLERCTEIVASIVMPGHGPLLQSLGPLRDLNRGLVHDVAAHVLEFAERPVTAESLLTRLLRHYGATVNDAPGYYLLHPTVFAFLSYLQESGRIAHEVIDGESLWRAM
ncbi:MAG: MBL fold metallo-hydrolase [Thermomicrobiales bacterium]|nr:MBL fold metallo-hydrolase [Thermomicrobiales bacterium]